MLLKETGYTARILRVNLNTHTFIEEILDESVVRKYIGGTALGAKYLCDLVPPGVQWNDPGNILVFASGILGGTTVPGSGTFSVVTKGALTEGATSAQANGFLGAYLKLSGFDAVVIEGSSLDWVYIYIHDGKAEFINASYLAGKDTWETEDAIKEQLGLPERKSSVFSIGPAGENLVRFAAIVGDRGHVAAHNGTGAVMGSKKLKAICVARGNIPVPVKDKGTVSEISKQIVQRAKSRAPSGYEWGTSMLYDSMTKLQCLPVRNLTGSTFPDYKNFTGEVYRPQLEMKWTPCWACQAHHCHLVKILEGPYAGFIGDEPEYECLAAWGSIIDQHDIAAAIVLSNETDRLGMDVNESGWLVAMLMECYEKGLITKQNLDGLDLTWGNVEAVRELLPRIALRKGFGNILAEGVMRACQTIGKGAMDIGVFARKGHTPRGHDHRARWPELFDTVTSSVGTLESGGIEIPDVLSPIEVSTAIAQVKGSRFLRDSLGICLISVNGVRTITQGKDQLAQDLVNLVNAVTGWDCTEQELDRAGFRAANLLRVFNLRHGITSEADLPSTRYGSAPDYGFAKGKSILTNWKQMIENYYQLLGWDIKTGIPLPETLHKLDLDHIIPDILRVA